MLLLRVWGTMRCGFHSMELLTPEPCLKITASGRRAHRRWTADGCPRTGIGLDDLLDEAAPRSDLYQLAGYRTALGDCSTCCHTCHM